VRADLQSFRATGRQHDDPDEEFTLRSSTSMTEDPSHPLLPPASHYDMVGEGETIIITRADITDMGLDAWSATDRAFVEELLSMWWGRKAQIQGARIKCCGVQIL
jgi:hypothetical protein